MSKKGKIFLITIFTILACSIGLNIYTISTQNMKLNKQKDSFDKEIVELQNKLTTCGQYNAALRQQNNELQSEIKENKNTINNLDKELTEAKKKL